MLHTPSPSRHPPPVWSDIAPHSRRNPRMRLVWRDRSPHFRRSPPAAHCVERYCSIQSLANHPQALCGASPLHTPNPTPCVEHPCSTQGAPADIHGRRGAPVLRSTNPSPRMPRNRRHAALPNMHLDAAMIGRALMRGTSIRNTHHRPAALALSHRQAHGTRHPPNEHPFQSRPRPRARPVTTGGQSSAH